MADDPAAVLAELTSIMRATEQIAHAQELWEQRWQAFQIYRGALEDVIDGADELLSNTSGEFHDSNIPELKKYRSIVDLRAARARWTAELAALDGQRDQIEAEYEQIKEAIARLKEVGAAIRKRADEVVKAFEGIGKTEE